MCHPRKLFLSRRGVFGANPTQRPPGRPKDNDTTQEMPVKLHPNFFSRVRALADASLRRLFPTGWGKRHLRNKAPVT